MQDAGRVADLALAVTFHALDVVELLVEEISRVPTLSPVFVLPEKGRVPPTIVTLLLSFLHTSGAIWSALCISLR